MEMPFGMRPASLAERARFYRGFDLARAQRWVGRKTVYAAVIGRHTGLAPAEYAADKDVPLIIDDYRSLDDVMDYIRAYLPEGVYYDRNHYKDISLCHSHDLRRSWTWSNFDGQELAFDIDPENIACPEHGSLRSRLAHGQGLSFCEHSFWKARDNALSLHDALSSRWSDVRIVFSGRGFHLHVFDDDARRLSRDERRVIAREHAGLGIDKWVTEGEMRLIRLPYSLNGVSNRVVTPLSKSKLGRFDPERDALP